MLQSHITLCWNGWYANCLSVCTAILSIMNSSNPYFHKPHNPEDQLFPMRGEMCMDTVAVEVRGGVF